MLRLNNVEVSYLNVIRVLHGVSLSVEDGSIVEIARGSRLRGIAISPGGNWLVYQVTSSGDPSQDGLWLAKTDTSQRRRLDLFGAYRWRDDGRLYLIPLDLSQPFHVLWEVEAASGVSRPLTDPAITPFKIANGDWSISPDGRQVAFVSAEDHNIWLLRLP